ncbi:hypothetical protein EES41_01355 [Streptomyces sp. ADI95-16]|nr:hypothetical protein EES41_01355 [Streptomyces sp. ADI95-16]
MAAGTPAAAPGQWGNAPAVSVHTGVDPAAPACANEAARVEAGSEPVANRRVLPALP